MKNKLSFAVITPAAIFTADHSVLPFGGGIFLGY